jgi:hypothetical protein
VPDTGIAGGVSLSWPDGSLTPALPGPVTGLGPATGDSA